MDPQQESTHNFTSRAKTFNSQESIQKLLRFNDNGNPNVNEDLQQLVTIRPGLHVATFRVNPQVRPRYNFDVEDTPVGFAFHLSGKLEATLERGRGKKPFIILNHRGINTVARLHGAKGHGRHLSDEILDAVVVYADPQMVTNLIIEEQDGVSKETRNLFQHKNIFFSLPMTREMYNVAAQALYHPYQGTVARLHLESCGLALLALQIELFTRRDIDWEKPLLRADEERIRMAGEILVQKMASPPTISALASQLGVNSAKLKRGFKQVFGTTIGQFLMQYRMTCARELLLNRETDVTQAALAVGYSNVSHFIRYYKKTFGVTPGCHKQARQQGVVPRIHPK